MEATPRYALYMLLAPAGSTPAHAAFTEAEALSQKAAAAYEARRDAEAAALFLRAAVLLRLAPDHPDADIARTNRGHLYENAAIAYAAAGAAAQGDVELARAAREDLACAARIQVARERFLSAPRQDGG